MCLQALGLQLSIVTASDPDPNARTFMERNFCIESLHATMSDQTSAWLEDPGGRPDMFVAGVPCKPYSTQRAKRFAAGSVKRHHNFETTFSEFFDWLDVHDPRSGILENVLGMDEKMDTVDETTPLQMPPGCTRLRVFRVLILLGLLGGMEWLVVVRCLQCQSPEV